MNRQQAHNHLSARTVTLMPHALITGAAGGLGAAIARALAPTHSLLLGGRPSPRLDTLADELVATRWPVDLSDQDAILAAVVGIDALDVLVHNAGVSYPATLADSNLADWRKTLDVNVLAPVALTQALLPALRAAQGDVVFINSGAGINAHPGIGSYSVSKFALRGFADVLRAEEPALRVTSVHPGRISTPMQQELTEHEGREYNPGDYMRPESVAQLVADAVNLPRDARVHQIVVRQN
ncbi:Putative short-chain dehydrogenase/reductase [Mycobacteroides abscessus subsp. massiliense]|uniref:Putative short-chain dehydrogenase/reductase n=2 Tax=Mycobacteroides abscessus TaxID=36809 RepID=A0A0U0ZLD7_9MYCO|nr:Putative short-chain dehydrogenase/reductase [Mycobacteroides abscessus]SKN04943.1 3-oxoacyl-[acyl-carrier-protein] reductase [Mycobacteroides abscessus subsp. massiliense]SKV05000.1 3-oxoacyl-[acyl-carrier-protein] reductase [Mycobacteroides abscessus subsp. abscessus]SKN87835.1 3-oxoacyl-[acyl-carrier-protein] reductase [Mycobacteroides abscessus subsp. massiliense]SKQ21343.1 Putative short-chain dehydrogenase/reductase [Mycobacteroides abscessus subsp. massiliense]